MIRVIEWMPAHHHDCHFAARYTQRNDLRATIEEVRLDCTDLRCRLLNVQNFWEAIHKACEELKMLADLARKLPESSAQGVRDLSTQYLKQVRELSEPMVQILRAYSSGRELDF